MTRRERQSEQIAAALGSGDCARVLVLAREHLAEFPSDEEVEAMAVEARRRSAEVDPDE
jgi:hypothetical protein